MRLLTLALAVSSLAAAGSALAAPVTDVGYMQAARCKGLAEGVGQPTPALDAFLKKQSYVREDAVVQRGKEEEERGRHEVASGGDKAQAEAQLSGVCAAYLKGNASEAGAAR